jgi:hypothetical protein
VIECHTSGTFFARSGERAFWFLVPRLGPRAIEPTAVRRLVEWRIGDGCRPTSRQAFYKLDRDVSAPEAR